MDGEKGCPNILSVEFKGNHFPLLVPSSVTWVELRLWVPEASEGQKLLEGSVPGYIPQAQCLGKGLAFLEPPTLRCDCLCWGRKTFFLAWYVERLMVSKQT